MNTDLIIVLIISILIYIFIYYFYDKIIDNNSHNLTVIKSIKSHKDFLKENYDTHHQHNKKTYTQSGIDQKLMRINFDKEEKSSKKLFLKFLYVFPKFTQYQIYLFFICSFLIPCIILYIFINKIIISLLLSLIFSILFPIMFINFNYNRKIKLFLDNFTSALDAIIRGVRSGIPVQECFEIIKNDTHPAVAEQFSILCRDLRVGISMDQVMMRFSQRVPLREVRFFSIAITTQAKSGGNLSNILENLSIVLRRRKNILLKIKTLSQEAKTTAIILMSLPLILLTLLSFVGDGYTMPLFKTETGNYILIGGLIWMSIGGLIMRKMINFYQ